MDLPRIHFAGQFRADPNTRNNINCNYDARYGIDYNYTKDYNFNGTGEFSFFNCSVTSVVTNDGKFSKTDPIVDSPIVNNKNMSFPKLVDLDVDYQLFKATVYGMRFGVNWKNVNGTETLAFRGDWGLNVIAQDLWSRSICTDVSLVDVSHRLGTHSVTVLSNVEWGDVSRSPALQQLRDAVEIENDNKLSVSITLYFYTRNYPTYLFRNFTLGYVVGTIGVAKPNEPVNFGGNRLLSFDGIKQPILPLEQNDSCYAYQGGENQPHWMYKAPFQVNEERKTLTVDLSNSVPQQLHGIIRDIGDLSLGIITVRNNTNCIMRVGENLPYKKAQWLEDTGGVIDQQLTDEQVKLLQSSKLAIVRQAQDIVIDAELGYYQQQLNIVASSALNETDQIYIDCTDDKIIYQLMLLEASRFIRPMEYYVTRLEYNESFNIRLLVSGFGKPKVKELVRLSLQNYNKTIPVDGVAVEPSSGTAYTDNDGIATFTFRVIKKLPLLRQYHDAQKPCNLTQIPVDGQVYMFNYTVNGSCTSDANNFVSMLLCSNAIAILAFSYIEPTETPTWAKNIYPIFNQYDRITPVMHQMIDLSDYYAVLDNTELIKLAMKLDFNHPSYMPVTRDLSPAKQNMILKWFENPIYDELDSSMIKAKNTQIPVTLNVSCAKPPTLATINPVDQYFLPPRCNISALLDVDDTPDKSDEYFKNIFENTHNYDKRPLWRVHIDSEEKCNRSNLLGQLQLAVELEFSTLPVYLTSLYSIVHGCNIEVYNLLHSVIMQEMLHMVQAANILIAIGGTPIIDNNKTVPNYPTIGLPGGVLPHLKVTLQKASLIHIYYVFMGIEVPHNTSVDRPDPDIFNDTIGQFYDEIRHCIDVLGDDIFVNGGRPDLQVKWPWAISDSSFGKVHIVTNVTSANDAIEEIVEQGEGANPYDPTYSDEGDIAHFYKFEEIVCQRHLVRVNISGKPYYQYSGTPIHFEPEGVWQMTDNPSKDSIPPNNNCYTEARAFHAAYRSLLKALQRVFSGYPDQIGEVVTNMESLGVHARKLMWTKVKPNDDLTCGPVWDYEWDD